MASQPSDRVRFAYRYPAVAFRIETDDLPSAELSGRLLFALGQAFEAYLQASGAPLTREDVALQSVRVGSLTGELVALVLDQVKLQDLRDIVAGFLPVFEDAVRFLLGEKLGRPNQANLQLSNSISNSIINGNVTQFNLSVPYDPTVPDVQIDASDAERMQLKLAQIGYSPERFGEPSGYNDHRRRRRRRKAQAFAVQAFRAAGLWYGKFPDLAALVPLYFGVGATDKDDPAGSWPEGVALSITGYPLYDDAGSLAGFQLEHARRDPGPDLEDAIQPR